MNSRLLTIIVVSFNTADLTLATLESIQADLLTTPALAVDTQLIVVDNHSTDDSVAKLKTWQKKANSKGLNCQLIINATNVGFAQANNQALKKFPARYYWLLNSDTHFSPGTIDQLLATFSQHPQQESTSYLSSSRRQLDNLGIVAPALLNLDGSIQPQGGHLPNLSAVANWLLFLDDLPLVGHFLPSVQNTGRHTNWLAYQRGRVFPQPWVGGTAMLITDELITEIGYLDENIFMYGEDIEFCWRAQNHQFDIVINPQAKVTHLGSASSNSGQAIIGEFKSLLYLFAKYQPQWQMFWLKSLIWLGAWLRILLFRFSSRHQSKVSIYQQVLSLLT